MSEGRRLHLLGVVRRDFTDDEMILVGDEAFYPEEWETVERCAKQTRCQNCKVLVRTRERERAPA